MNAALFSSATDLWATPQGFFDKLNAEFGFELDVCATVDNAKCARFFTIADDGLKQEWRGGERRVIWMNPPYGEPEQPCKQSCKKKRCSQRGFHNGAYRPGIIDWMRKAYEASLAGETVVCLVPARTDTRWWHDYAMKGEVRFVRGRLKFGGVKDSAPFPSAVVVLRPPAPVATRRFLEVDPGVFPELDAA